MKPGPAMSPTVYAFGWIVVRSALVTSRAMSSCTISPVVETRAFFIAFSVAAIYYAGSSRLVFPIDHPPSTR